MTLRRDPVLPVLGSLLTRSLSTLLVPCPNSIALDVSQYSNGDNEDTDDDRDNDRTGPQGTNTGVEPVSYTHLTLPTSDLV